MKIGTPILKMKNDNAKIAKDKNGKSNSGRISGLLKELYDRWSKSLTLDKTLSYLNTYEFPDGCNNCDEAIAYMVEQYTQDFKQKYGDRKIRNDCVYGFTGIIKAPAEQVNAMDADERTRFMNDSLECYKETCAEHNITIDGYAIHRDEEGEHIHVIGHSNTYDVHDFDLPFKGALNRDFPAKMREHGWEIEDNVRDETKPRKSHGKSVNTYLRDRVKDETEKLMQDKKILTSDVTRLTKDKSDISGEISGLQEKKNSLQIDSEKLNVEISRKATKSSDLDVEISQKSTKSSDLDVKISRKSKKNEELKKTNKGLEDVQAYYKGVQHEMNDRLFNWLNDIQNSIIEALNASDGYEDSELETFCKRRLLYDDVTVWNSFTDYYAKKQVARAREQAEQQNPKPQLKSDAVKPKRRPLPAGFEEVTELADMKSRVDSEKDIDCVF